MQFLQLLFIGGIVGLLMVVGIFALIPLAALMYLWRSIYPLIKRMALWTAKGENYFPLIIIVVILSGSTVLLLIMALSIDILFILLFLGMLALTQLFFIPILLGTLVWCIRILGWIFDIWKAIVFRVIGPATAEVKLWLIVNYLKLLIWIEGSATTTSRPAPVTKAGVRPTHRSHSVKTVSNKTTARITTAPTSSTAQRKTVPVKPGQKAVKTAQKTPFFTRAGDIISSWLYSFRFGNNMPIPMPPSQQSDDNLQTPGMSAKDKLMMKMMTSPTVIKIFSNPTVVKLITKMMLAYMAVSTRLSSRKKQ